MKKFMLAIFIAFTFVGRASAEVKYPFDVYSGSFGPDILGMKLGEKFNPVIIYNRFADQKRAHNDNTAVIKLIYDFYTEGGKNKIKLIVSEFDYIENRDTTILSKIDEADFSRAGKSAQFAKEVIENSFRVSDNQIIGWMEELGFTHCFRSISLKEKEGGRTVIAVSARGTRVSSIRINSNKEEISKIGYENIVKQTLEILNLEGFERKVNKHGDDYFEDNRIGYKVIFYKTENGEINTVLELAAIQ